MLRLLEASRAIARRRTAFEGAPMDAVALCLALATAPLVPPRPDASGCGTCSRGRFFTTATSGR